MAVQLTPDSSAALLAAHSTQKPASPRQSDSSSSAAVPSSRELDSVQLHSSAATSKIRETHRSVAQLQRGLGVLEVANRFLREASKHLGEIKNVVTSGKTDSAARLTLANNLANLDQVVRGAKFEGKNVLAGTEFPVSAAGAQIKIGVGSQDLQDLASLLASGGRGLAAINLDRPGTSAKSIQQANSLVAAAQDAASSQTGTLEGLVNQLGVEFDKVVPSALLAAKVPTAVAAVATAIAAAPTAAVDSQTVSAPSASRLLAD